MTTLVGKRQSSEPETGYCHFENLPNELLLHIFSYADFASLSQLSLTCRRFSLVLDDKSIWQNILKGRWKTEKEFPHPRLEVALRTNMLAKKYVNRPFAITYKSFGCQNDKWIVLQKAISDHYHVIELSSFEVKKSFFTTGLIFKLWNDILFYFHKDVFKKCNLITEEEVVITKKEVSFARIINDYLFYDAKGTAYLCNLRANTTKKIDVDVTTAPITHPESSWFLERRLGAYYLRSIDDLTFKKELNLYSPQMDKEWIYDARGIYKINEGNPELVDTNNTCYFFHNFYNGKILKQTENGIIYGDYNFPKGRYHRVYKNILIVTCNTSFYLFNLDTGEGQEYENQGDDPILNFRDHLLVHKNGIWDFRKTIVPCDRGAKHLKSS